MCQVEYASSIETRPVLDHRYELVKLIGSGGNALWFVANDYHTQREVTLKVLRSELAKHPRQVAKFRNEALMLGRNDVHRVVEIRDACDATTSYVVLRDIADLPTALAKRVARSGRLQPVAVLQIADDVLAALVDLHAEGKIHGDVSPTTVMAHAVDRAMLLAPQRGTYSYFSAPELERGQRSDARTDLYGVGLVMLYAVTGIDPRLLRGDFTEPLNELPRAFSRIVMHAIASRPAARFLTARHMRTAIQRARQDIDTRRVVALELPE